jgi:elongation factor Ts
MANITPKMVKDLREKTGAGMADCKKALTETDGDMTAAIEFLRKKGAASAAKRADKTASEGRIFVKTSDDLKTGVIVEVNCETDFVAMNDEFLKFVDIVGNTVMNGEYKSYDEMKAVEVEGATIEQHYNDILAKFSEKIEVRRLEKVVTEGSVVTYLHSNGKLGVLMDVTAPALEGASLDNAKDITMQIAAMNPSFIDRSVVDQATIDKEVEIYRTQALESGKKEEIADRIAQGRVEKFYGESCLVEQTFVKDNKKVVADILKEIGEDVKVKSFKRFALGEEV